MILKNTAILVIILALSGALLGFANDMTKNKIEEIRIEAYMQTIGDLFPEIDSLEEMEGYREVYLGGKLIGYLAEGESKGYQSNIRVMVAFGIDKEINGVRIIEQGETPGVGTRVTENHFLDMFKGSDPDEVDAITGATVSSVAVKSAVAQARGALP